MIIAGVMSGSSLDGLDIALVHFRDDAFEVLSTHAVSYSEEWESRLRNYHALDAQLYIRLKYEYSYYVSSLILNVLESVDTIVDYVSFHGHTICHHPELGYTEQIGNGGIISGVTGLGTITDFRSQDVALAGVGTPLVPYFETRFLDGYDYYLNLGGIANITALSGNFISAYDVCPCNQVLNYFSQKVGLPYDDKGQLAAQGTYLVDLYSYFSGYDYFSKSAPKSLDNNWIRSIFIENIPEASVSDSMHTFVHWMADCIAEQVNNEKSTRLFATGGGCHNDFFMQILETNLQRRNCELVVPNVQMVDYKEAILMAALAASYIKGEYNVLSSVTGAKKDSIGGALYKVR